MHAPAQDHSFLAQIVIAGASSVSPLAVDVSAVPGAGGDKVELCVREDDGARAIRMDPGKARRIAHALLVAADFAEVARS